MHLETLRDDEELAGQKELAEPAAPGLHPERETKPGGTPA
jgi:POT family proton-dependent oligopeptide transporter